MKNENDKEITINENLGYQYEFDINLISIKFEYKSPFNFKILISRGSNQNEINKIFKYDTYFPGYIPIMEEFSIVSVLNPKDYITFDFTNIPVYSEKKYQIFICVFTKSGFKPAIVGEINLSDYIDNNKENELILNNSTFSDVILKYKITTKFISEFDQDINKLKKDIPEFENEEIDFSEISRMNYFKKKSVEIEEKNTKNSMINRYDSLIRNSNEIQVENLEKENKNLKDNFYNSRFLIDSKVI